MYNQQQGQLPAHYDRLDNSTFNHHLPHGNEIFPPIQQPPTLDPQTLNSVPSLFRYRLQESGQRGPVNAFTYNYLSRDFFNNRDFTDWVQRVADFAEFLIVNQNEHPQQAVEKAVTLIYKGCLAAMVGQFPPLGNLIDGNTLQEIHKAGNDLQAILTDVNAFHQRGRTPLQQQPQGYGPPPPQQQGYGYQQTGGGYAQSGQLPPVRPNGPMNAPSPQPQMASAAPSQYPMNGGPQPTSPTGPKGAPAGGRYGSEVVQPQQSWTAGQTSTMAHMTPPNVQGSTAPTPTPTPEPVVSPHEDVVMPNTVEEIELEPHAQINSDTPYDHVVMPGGIEAYPYHRSPWTRTRSDMKPYAMGYDPQKYVLFHVKWPDGIVEEKLVEYGSMQNMDYLKHEIDAQLRGAKIKPEGKVVPSTHKVLDFDEPLKPVEEVKQALDDGLLTKDTLKPVILDGEFTGSTDIDNEVEAREQVAEQLGIEEPLDVVPAHEYVSVKLYTIDVDEEGRERLEILATTDTLPGLARGLVEALNDGVLPLRYYRFFNQRLTEMVNQNLHDNMGMETLSIDSFVDDIEELYDYLAENHGLEMTKVFKSHTKSMLAQWMCLREEEVDGVVRLSLVDRYTNLQLPWSSDAIASLNLDDEAVLLSSSTHPTITKVVLKLMTRHDEEGGLLGKTFRLITTDGIYIKVLRGWLVETAVLLKKQD